MKQIEIEGRLFSLEIRRKDIRNLILRLKSAGELAVSAPLSVTETEVMQFVRSRSQWILRHSERLARQKDMQSVKTDEHKITLYGRPVKLVVAEGSGRSTLQAERLVLFVRSVSPESVKREFDRFARRSLENTLEKLRIRWDQVASDYRLPLPEIVVRPMTSRWGSCIPAKGKITINLKLIHYPEKIIDSVLWHEYAHLVIPNHSARFYSLIEHHMPEYRTLKAMLNGEL